MNNDILTLMYHGITDANTGIPPDREAGAELYDVSLQNFRAQMQWLKQNVFNTVSLTRSSLPQDKSKSILLTFDDGEANNYFNALPVLRELGFYACFFVTFNRVGKPGYMDWNQLQELLRNGMSIGSHGLSHEVLTEQSAAVVKNELVESKRILENKLQAPIVSFSVPRGFYNQAVLNLAKVAGYQTIFVSHKEDSDSVSTGRMAVKKNWSIRRFEQAVLGKTPWQEKSFEAVKNFTKKFLGSENYKALRSRILNKRV